MRSKGESPSAAKDSYDGVLAGTPDSIHAPQSSVKHKMLIQSCSYEGCDSLLYLFYLIMSVVATQSIH